MDKTNFAQGSFSPLRGWAARRNLRRLPAISSRLRIAYALVSFLLTATYFRVLMILNFQFSPWMLLFSLLGGLCFAVCIFNLVSIWAENQ